MKTGALTGLIKPCLWTKVRETRVISFMKQDLMGVIESGPSTKPFSVVKSAIQAI